MKICIVTGTRAEYGLLRPLLELLSKDDDCSLQIVATGMHLSPEFGNTYRAIEDDGFLIDEKVEMLISSDTSCSVVKSIGLGMISFADSLQRLSPDMVVVLGDRSEILSAVVSAFIQKIPIAHIHGGETTEGAYDEGIRHSITKMSALHFASTPEYKRRIEQLGENPDHVFHVGALGVQNIKKINLLNIEDLQKKIEFSWGKNKLALITFHPLTLSHASILDQVKALLAAIDSFDNLSCIFTLPNSDSDGRKIREMIESYVEKNTKQAISFVSMGILRYLSTMKQCDVVLGNSSSGIIEAPSFGVPTVNIGNRQKGRIAADSVIHCESSKKSIKKALEKSFSPEFILKAKNCQNPYEHEDSAMNILSEIKKNLKNGLSIQKKFFDWSVK